MDVIFGQGLSYLDSLKKRYLDFVILCKDINKELGKVKVDLKQSFPPLQSPKQSKGDNKTTLDSLETFLNNLIKNKELRENSKALYDFLETSLLHLPEGPKVYKEGYLEKRAGGRYTESRIQTYCGLICKRWLKRWFIVSEEGLLYTVNSNNNKIREMLLFDQSFQIEYGRKATGSKSGITIITPTRKLNLKAPNFFQAIEWIVSIQEAVDKCHYVKINRYLSFAPIRNPTSYCKSFIDGEGYYSDIYEALIQATKEVFIAGWWISPEFYLKRPVQDENLDSRLDRVLKKIADRGVKVYILLYREVKLALYNDSAYTKNALQSLSPNIRVLRHPNEFLFFWSHHEKLVIIDHHVGFLGGLDLCYGRMDINSHPLCDPTYEESGFETFPGIDYSNPRILDFRNVRAYETPLIKKNIVPRLPWHDVAMMVVGEPVKDLARHFIQCWNFAQIDLKGKDDYFITPKIQNQSPNEKIKAGFEKIKIKMREMLKLKSSETLADIKPEEFSTDKRLDVYVQTKAQDHSLSVFEIECDIDEENQEIKFPKKDKNKNFDINYREEFDEQRIKEHKNLVISGNNKNRFLKMKTDRQLVTQPVGDNFPAEIIAHSKSDRKSSKEKRASVQSLQKLIGNEKDIPLSAKKSMDLEKDFTEDHAQQDFNQEYITLLKKARQKEILFEKKSTQFALTPQKQSSNFDFLLDDNNEKKQEINDNFFEENMLQPLWRGDNGSPNGTCSCQVLRSASSWSLGLNSGKNFLENSIQNAYIENIQNAKKFIYIENQFFISGTAGEPVANQVAKALVLRIEKAHQFHEKFRVVVFLPLLPAFEGEVDDPKATVLRIQLYWQYQTICRGTRSLYGQLLKKGIPDPSQYIEFYSLRQHAKLKNLPVTEILYIHSKLMIVDDNVVILGSANINDRSMQGSRDSEIAMITEDKKKVEGILDTKKILVGEFAYKLRKGLWMEHLNLPEEKVQDPLDDALIFEMNKRAKRNTEIYREVFCCYPDDNVKKLNEIKEFRKLANLESYDRLSSDIKGHIVQFPLQFLERENLKFSVIDKEFYVPEINFT